jgi:hypothetical protein
MTDETEVFWSPGDVAKHLGVSPSGLRRLAGVYAQVHGDLPKDSSGTSRRWPSKAVSRLEQARALMAAGQARSIKDALLAVESGATPSADVALALGQEGRVVEALGVVAARLEALYDSNRRLHLEVEALRGELRARDQGSLPAAPRAYGGAQAAGKGEQAVTADEGISNQLERTEANRLVVRVAKWLERLLRR